MSNTTTVDTGGCGCGCLMIILTIPAILILWALWFGLSTPWGILNIDILWPAIHLN